MINIEDILSIENRHIEMKVNDSKTIIEDLAFWFDEFFGKLKKEEASENTIVSYNDVLKALMEYCTIYLKDLKKVSQLTHQDVNDFLYWMENYKTNKEYGSIKERLSYLVHFIKYAQASGTSDFILVRDRYLSDVTHTEIARINYALDEFENFYYEKEIPFSKMDNEYLKKFVASIPKASVTTMMHRRAVVHKFFAFVFDETKDEIFEEILKNMKLYKKPKGSVHKKKGIDEVVLKKLFVFIDEYIADPKNVLQKPTKRSKHIAYRNTAMVLLMYGAGCRASEALSIRMKDIVDEGKAVYKVLIYGGKGNKNRTTYIKKELFKRHYDYFFGYVKSADQYLSLNSNGKKMSRINLYQAVVKMFIAIDEVEKGLHIFRHEFGSSFAEKNGNIKLLQELLGHSDISTTMIYSSVGEKAKEKAIEELK